MRNVNIPAILPSKELMTDQLLDALRLERKRKVSATREKAKMGHLERQFDLASEDEPARTYRVFLRQSATNPDVFSVGLTVSLADSDLVLCRYNSDHHSHRNILEKEKLTHCFHQHITKAHYLEAGLNDSGFAVMRTEYNSVESALALLIKECNIKGISVPQTQQNLL